MQSILLRLRCPGNSKLLSDINYSEHLTSKSSSVGVLFALLSPMAKLFNEQNYGPPYNSMTLESKQPANRGSSALQEHGEAVSPNSNSVAAAAPAPSTDTAIKEEDLSTDEDEAGLFSDVEKYIAP